MNTVRKRKFRNFLKKNKKWLLGGGIFVLVGIIGLWLGFEIADDWHAIRNWLNGPYSTTFFICLAIGVLIIATIVVVLVNFRRGDDL